MKLIRIPLSFLVALAELKLAGKKFKKTSCNSKILKKQRNPFGYCQFEPSFGAIKAF